MKQAAQIIGCFGIACIVGFSAQRFVHHVEHRQALESKKQEQRMDSSTSNVVERAFASLAIPFDDHLNSTKHQPSDNSVSFNEDVASTDHFDDFQHSIHQWEINKPQIDNQDIPREAYLIRGWSLFHVGEYEDAATVFEKLYQTQADSESAHGIVACLRAGGDMARLDRLAVEWGGALAEQSSLTASTRSN